MLCSDRYGLRSLSQIDVDVQLMHIRRETPMGQQGEDEDEDEQAVEGPKSDAQAS